MIIHIHVKNRVATFVPDDGFPVCGNSTDIVQFTFDEEWAGKKKKVARFLWGGNLFHEENLTDDACEAPMFLGTDRVLIGVYAKDDGTDYALSSTRAEVPYRTSIRCGSAKPSAESTEAYVHETKAFADAAQESAEEASVFAGAAQGSAEAAAASASAAATYLDTVEADAVSARDFAEAAQNSVARATEAADKAAEYRNGAQESAQAASASAVSAAAEREGAQTAAATAQQKATAAELAASGANDSAAAAKTAASGANDSAAAAKTAATAAQSFSKSAQTQANTASEASKNASLCADRAQTYASVAKDAKDSAIESAAQALESRNAAQLYAEQAETVARDLEERGFASSLNEHNMRIAILENHLELDSPIVIVMQADDTIDVPDNTTRYAKVSELLGVYLANTWSDGWYGQGVVGIRAIGEDEKVLYSYDFPLESLPDYGVGRDIYTVKRGENWSTCNYLSFLSGRAFYHHNVYSVEMVEAYGEPEKRNEGDTVVDQMGYSALLKLETPEVTDVTDLLGFDGILDTEGVVRFEFLQLHPADSDIVQMGALSEWWAAPVRVLFEKN